jgi:T3SS negative regulator,GrlR
MRNGLYSIHIHMLDGVRGRDSGVIILRDGRLISGGPYFWSVGSYTVGEGTWKGHLATNQHTDFPDPFVRRFSAIRKRPVDFRGPLPVTMPRSSGPRWSAATAASASARR